jgi:predicted component of type VI protein secretion system
VELLISTHCRENGARNSTRRNLNGELVLGRGPESPLLLDGTGISREHFRLHSAGDDIFVTDLSSNGTWLNTKRLQRGDPHPLAPADAIEIPGFEIRIDWKTMSANGHQQIAPPVVAAAPAEPSRRGFAASFSAVEKFVIVLALTTFSLVVFYFFS